jgi:pimeloyl-ACP methyl ester carboxylesterase
MHSPRSTRRRFGLWAAIATALAASGIPGCGFIPREAVVPMPTQLDKSSCIAPARTLLVILPGRGMTTRELEKEGFVAAVRSAGLAVDVLRADAHYGYYKDRSILDRLRADVVVPAQAQGYRAIWLAGISMGGLGALLYAEAHPGDVAGILMLAPYLGEPDTAEAVAKAGGPMQWPAPAGPLPDAAIGPRAWRGVQDLLQRGDAIARPPLYLGYGLQDDFAPSLRVLAQALPAGRVFSAAGGHDWDPWLGLWRRMLAASDLPRC